jgi:hypothetical protein
MFRRQSKKTNSIIERHWNARDALVQPMSRFSEPVALLSAAYPLGRSQPVPVDASFAEAVDEAARGAAEELLEAGDDDTARSVAAERLERYVDIAQAYGAGQNADVEIAIFRGIWKDYAKKLRG